MAEQSDKKSVAPHVQASFINAIAEEGTKQEAVEWLQRIWNELCQAEANLRKAQEENAMLEAMNAALRDQNVAMNDTILARSATQRTTDGPTPNAATSEVRSSGAQRSADENADAAGRGAERQSGSIPDPSAIQSSTAESKPVAWRFKNNPQSDWRHLSYPPAGVGPDAIVEPLYTHSASGERRDG